MASLSEAISKVYKITIVENTYMKTFMCLYVVFTFAENKLYEYVIWNQMAG